jgi:hypothetical protein
MILSHFHFLYDIMISSLRLFSTKLMNNILNFYSAKLVDALLFNLVMFEFAGMFIAS